MKKSAFHLGISLFITIVLNSSAFALDSVLLYLDNDQVPFEKIKNQQSTNHSVTASEGIWLVAGTLSHPDLSIMTTNHVTLLDAKGHNIPLLIERQSLTYQSDHIRSLFVVFQISKTHNIETPLRLLWSKESEPLAKNKEQQAISFPPDQSQFIGFHIVAEEFQQSTVLVEVDMQKGRYRFWYLFPILLVLLFSGFRFWRRYNDN